MATSLDIDVAKDRLVDSLSNARDVAVSAVMDDIAPAVVAAVGAAREASGPAYAEASSRASDVVSEAASRASDAVTALRGSDAAKALRDSDAMTKLRGKQRTRSKRWPIIAAVIGIGAAAVAVIKARSSQVDPPPRYPAPTEAAKPAEPTASTPPED